MKRKNNLILIFLIVICSCKNDLQLSYDFNSVYKSYQEFCKDKRSKNDMLSMDCGELVVLAHDKTDRVNQIKSFYQEGYYGHFFQFKNDFLERYCYLVSSNTNTYEIEFNLIGNKMVNGNPLVEIYNDTLKNTSTLYFSEVLYDSLTVYLSSINNKEKKIDLEVDSLMPFLKRVTVSNEKDVYIKMSGFYDNLIIDTYFDTILTEHVTLP